MCCEICPKYEKCEEFGKLKENCCSRCPDYLDCADVLDKKEDPFGDLLPDGGDENNFN